MKFNSLKMPAFLNQMPASITGQKIYNHLAKMGFNF